LTKEDVLECEDLGFVVFFSATDGIFATGETGGGIKDVSTIGFSLFSEGSGILSLPNTVAVESTAASFAGSEDKVGDTGFLTSGFLEAVNALTGAFDSLAVCSGTLGLLTTSAGFRVEGKGALGIGAFLATGAGIVDDFVDGEG